MTEIKKKYVKPEITVIEVDMQQMICTSPGSGNPEDGYPINDENPYGGQFM